MTLRLISLAVSAHLRSLSSAVPAVSDPLIRARARVCVRFPTYEEISYVGQHMKNVHMLPALLGQLTGPTHLASRPTRPHSALAYTYKYAYWPEYTWLGVLCMSWKLLFPSLSLSLSERGLWGLPQTSRF